MIVDQQFTNVDGGSGTDTLLWAGGDASIDLGSLVGRLHDIEVIDLNDSSSVTLSLSLADDSRSSILNRLPVRVCALRAGDNPAQMLVSLDADGTALLARVTRYSSDQLGLSTLEVARERGFEVPRDLSVISFDNTPLVHFTQPPLTAVDQPIAETVSCAVDLIIRAQKGEELPAGVTTVHGSLAERASVAPPA